MEIHQSVSMQEQSIVFIDTTEPGHVWMDWLNLTIIKYRIMYGIKIDVWHVVCSNILKARENAHSQIVTIPNIRHINFYNERLIKIRRRRLTSWSISWLLRTDYALLRALIHTKFHKSWKHNLLIWYPSRLPYQSKEKKLDRHFTANHLSNHIREVSALKLMDWQGEWGYNSASPLRTLLENNNYYIPSVYLLLFIQQ